MPQSLVALEQHPVRTRWSLVLLQAVLLGCSVWGRNVCLDGGWQGLSPADSVPNPGWVLREESSAQCFFDLASEVITHNSFHTLLAQSVTEARWNSGDVDSPTAGGAGVQHSSSAVALTFQKHCLSRELITVLP